MSVTSDHLAFAGRPLTEGVLRSTDPEAECAGSTEPEEPASQVAATIDVVIIPDICISAYPNW
ncbi:hypothetical protein AJ88_46400 [Mesorhizobium amorphae CCBAU 01583]|nr:hypothetical protein AJ88_46400 [Mesorhizobium amorphae CCBAU 01583]